MNVSEIRKLAEEGLSAQQIADRAGLTRQWVYVLARREGIIFSRSPSLSAPTPRVITGGISVPVTHHVAGRISEMLAAADLMARGWQVFMPIHHSQGHDLIISNGDVILTIEVRSAKRNVHGTLAYLKKDNCKSAYFAIVVTGEPVSYMPELPEINTGA